MLESLKQIGDYVIESGRVKGLEKYTALGSLSKVKKIIVLEFKTVNGKIEYTSTHTDEYGREKGKTLLYSPGPPSTFDLTPTSKNTGIATDKKTREEFSKTLKRIVNWFKEHSDQNEVFKEIGEAIATKQVEDDVLSNIRSLENDEPAVLTVTVNNNFPADIDDIDDILKDSFLKKLSEKHNTTSKGVGVCVLCGLEKEIVGFGFPYSFYTLDKPGFAQGLKQENSFKQFPLCEDCSVSLFLGKDFVEEYLRYGFYGNRLYVFPKFMTNKIRDKVMDEIIELRGTDKGEYKGGLLTEEENFSEMIKDKEDYLTLLFVICQQKGGGKYLDVLKYIESVPPSWIKELYDSLNSIYELDLFSEDSIKKSGAFAKPVGPLRNNLKYHSLTVIIRDFFGGYDVLGSLLSGKTIPEEELIPAFNKKLRIAFKRNWGKKIIELSLKSILLLELMNKLEGKMTKEKNNMGILGDLEGSLDSPGKKAAFYEGVLTGRLMSIQYYVCNGNTPFMKKLFGLNLNVERLKSIYPDIINKLKQYKRPLTELQIETSKHMLAAEKSGWDLSPEQASYYFTLGYTLNKLFKKEKEDKEDE